MHWTDDGRQRSDRAGNRRGTRTMTGINRRGFAAAGGALLGGLAASRPAHAGPETTEKSTMDIERIVITEPAGGVPIISLATVRGGLVYLCGVTADPAKLGDIKDQTREVLARIDRLLARAGTG